MDIDLFKIALVMLLSIPWVYIVTRIASNTHFAERLKYHRQALVDVEDHIKSHTE